MNGFCATAPAGSPRGGPPAPVQARLEKAPLDIDHPSWVEDDQFDIDRHIFRGSLPAPYDRATLERIVGWMHAKLLNRARPLWEFYVFEGMANNEVGLYSKMHHALIDGARERWRNSVAGLQDAMKVHAGVVANIDTNRVEMSSLVTASQSATGALQATQAGNQLIALQTQQVADLTAAVAAQGGEVIAQIAIPPTETSFTRYFPQIPAETEVLYHVMVGPAVLTFVKELGEFYGTAARPQIFGFIDSLEAVNIASPGLEFLEGTHFWEGHPRYKQADASAAETAYRAAVGVDDTGASVTDPNDIATYAHMFSVWETLFVIKDAMTAAGYELSLIHI